MGKKQQDITKSSYNNELYTIIEWISISSYKIECFSICIKYYQKIIHQFNFLSLVLSAANGTISVANYNYSSSQIYTQAINTINIIMMIENGSCCWASIPEGSAPAQPVSILPHLVNSPFIAGSNIRWEISRNYPPSSSMK